MKRWGAVIAVAAVLFGGCSSDSAKPPPSTTTSPPTTRTTLLERSTDLPDGRYQAIVTWVDALSNQMEIDLVEVLRGEAAARIYHIDNPDDPGPPPNDEFIVNNSPQLWRVGVGRDPVVTVRKRNGKEQQSATFSEVDTLRNWYSDIVIRDGVVVEVHEQYPHRNGRLPDGKYEVYVHHVDVAARTIDVDLVDRLSDDAANHAYHVEHPDDPTGPPNDYDVYRLDASLWTVPVAVDAKFVVLRYSGNFFEDRPGTLAEVSVENQWFVDIVVKGGKVVDLHEYYHP